MGSLFRSEAMTLCQLFLQSEAAYACVSELGELGLVQFRDLNPDVNIFQRKFVNEVRRCEEMERKLRFVYKEIERASIPMVDTGDIPDAPPPREMIDLESTFEQLENEMKEINSNQEALNKNFLELTELKFILRKTQTFFDEVENNQITADQPNNDDQQALLAEEGKTIQAAKRLSFVTGVIQRESLPGFERLLWRACRGNVFLRTAEIETPLEDPRTGDSIIKCVFIIFFQGEQLRLRIKKICEGFKATLYPCPENAAERREMAIGVMTRIEDLQVVLNQTKEHRNTVLGAAAKNINPWIIKVKKIKGIYHALNMFNLDVTHKCLIAECWCAVDDLDRIHQALKRGSEKSGSTVPSILNRMETKESPPTYNITNKFTNGFQNIVDAYGVADYQEVNPAPFAIVTFPFLFGVMFGDSGHGTLMFLFGLYLVLKEKSIAKIKGGEMVDTVFGGRYIILLMGICAIYTGTIYNDWFSRSLNIFGSQWYFSNVTLSDEFVRTHSDIQLNPKTAFHNQTPYPVGLDPIWQLAVNKLTFTNSFKMKMSVILGIFQMSFGVVLSLLNHLYFKRTVNIYCEFIPEVIFLGCIFGYMIGLIFFKWLAFTCYSEFQPSILLAMIDMFLNFGATIPKDSLLYAGQGVLQPILVALAVVAVPWMLLVKPLYLRREHQKAMAAKGSTVRYDTTSETAPIVKSEEPPEGVEHNEQKEEPEEEEEFDFGEIFVHQAIHTIEYCLGCISNTASYLRLWALSLAHAELSEVLWVMVLKIGFSTNGYAGFVVTWFMFGGWAALTIAILLIMEGLSAFLHALRLHWVEFQNKFYDGQGMPFQPFSFVRIMKAEEE
ncbi:V-type proton ATPase 116 kDa subunit a isoform 1 [Trichoplax sp. H2]|uniref:V-type proton ATPase subunit a n=1 Tax=Trichoplax adhaerens TaxID=10228 RepID=B3RPL7_TRIAD|nr:hypothetical protein TRIADDRAFT_63669 [Trichoplax adhaerens]EDV28211.1 hypothetical protein TRIADDRAFT_63669 [Trichoplax adhaerens]RDD45360.1 V-type proton ATPase 116 kDa subunit a isoform 1 [Trichoplax sp. H2]|eukprot:XP_002110045.1 hypothetical protein TRIADDRAFT_63669 [Trichoplax adhaerens]